MKSSSAILILAVVLAGQAQAGGAAFPKEATIHYRGYWSIIPLGSAVQKWHLDGNHYRVDTRISTFGYSVRYISNGDVVDGEMHPTYYAEFRNNASTPSYETRFDWATHMISYGKPGELKQSPLQWPVQDLNSIPYDLAWHGGQAITYKQLSNGHSLKGATLESGASVSVNVAGNALKTHYLVNHGDGETTEFWLADDWAMLPVRIRHDGSDKIELRATAIEIDGRTLNPP